jgi:non-canonical poly(A) RNA polymerase PAPD5/7
MTTRRLHDEIVAYMAYVQPTLQEETTRRQVYDFIKKTVKGRFARSEVNLFGSVAHDLCLPDGLVSCLDAPPTKFLC